MLRVLRLRRNEAAAFVVFVSNIPYKNGPLSATPHFAVAVAVRPLAVHGSLLQLCGIPVCIGRMNNGFKERYGGKVRERSEGLTGGRYCMNL